MKLPFTLILSGLKLLPKLKGMFFTKDKFSPKRSAITLIFFIVILFSYHFLGVEITNEGINQLDEISDVIGVAEVANEY